MEAHDTVSVECFRNNLVSLRPVKIQSGHAEIEQRQKFLSGRTSREQISEFIHQYGRTHHRTAP